MVTFGLRVLMIAMTANANDEAFWYRDGLISCL